MADEVKTEGKASGAPIISAQSGPDPSAVTSRGVEVTAVEPSHVLYLENAKLKFELESGALIEKHDKELRELRAYKWAVRLLFVFVLGGSIYSVLKVDDYVDKRVAVRIAKTDRIALALNQAQVGHWREAISLFDEVRAEMASGKLDAGPDFKRFLYFNALWLLGQAYEQNPDGTWVGQEQYDQLMKDQEFRREIFTNRSLQNDGDMMNLLGLCVLKYEQAPASLRKGRGYLEQALPRIYPVQRRANTHWSLAMLALLEDRQDSAIFHLKAAEDLFPNEFLIKDLVPYKNSFTRSEEFRFWADLATRLNRPGFAQTYENFITRIAAQPGA